MIEFCCENSQRLKAPSKMFDITKLKVVNALLKLSESSQGNISKIVFSQNISERLLLQFQQCLLLILTNFFE